MNLNRWTLPGLMLVATGCGVKTGAGTPFEQTTSGIKPGDPVDFDNDGVSDGFAVDSDMDGFADGVDTDRDGTVDVDLQGGGRTGATTGAAQDTTTDGMPGATGDNSTDRNCQEYFVRSERVIPDMLIVLDRSGSMQVGSTDRWGPSVTAIKDVTGQLESKINFGLMIFPTDNSCGAGEIQVPVGPMTAMSIAGELDAKLPNGSTPTAASLEAAHVQLGTALVGPDETPRSKLVLLVSDGSPNCFDIRGQCKSWDLVCLSKASKMVDAAAIQASVEAITSMANDGIKTYVVGYDTKSDAMLSSAMDMMAAAGGTGDTQHRAVEDSASLVKTLEEIAGKAVSCTFALDEAPPDPTYVRVTVDGQPVDLNQPDGWTLGADKKSVEVQGSACATLRSAGEHALNVEVKCVPVRVE